MDDTLNETQAKVNAEKIVVTLTDTLATVQLSHLATNRAMPRLRHWSRRWLPL